jgi:hypothetical protein
MLTRDGSRLAWPQAGCRCGLLAGRFGDDLGQRAVVAFG